MNKVEAYAELLLNSDAENAKNGLVSCKTSARLFDFSQSMTREEIKEAIALYNRIKPQKQ
jgi:hypothetical protein